MQGKKNTCSNYEHSNTGRKFGVVKIAAGLRQHSRSWLRVSRGSHDSGSRATVLCNKMGKYFSVLCCKNRRKNVLLSAKWLGQPCYSV
jgi:hypothetical protein